MARMIPSHFDVSIPSTAEKRLFELFKNDPATSEWVVIHSLGLSRRGKKPYGEIDFVVLIPSIGVFCLEVKGGGISCRDGVWQTIDRNGYINKLKRSPFLQAREGMFSMRDSVLERTPVGFPSEIIFGYAVVMPDITFREQSTEWEDWQVIDHESLKKPISGTILRLATEIRKMHPHLRPGEPNKSNLKIIQGILRPDFEVVVGRSARIEETEESILSLTNEQFVALDLLADNQRCLFEGPAGTGKTMLALEYARRSALAGKKTLLICYNRLLGDWFNREVKRIGLQELVTAGGFHKLLRNRIIGSSVASDFLVQENNHPTSDFYSSQYPICGHIAIQESKESFDVIVMDEAQDLLQDGVLDVLDVWVDGGLEAGRWAIFGDFQRQAIFHALTAEQMRRMVEKTTLQLAKGRLLTNCRNTRNIGQETALMSGFDAPPYRMGQIEGLPVDYRYYATEDEMRNALVVVIKKLLSDGVKSSEIVVVSPKKLDNSAAAMINDETGFRLVDINSHGNARHGLPLIHFSTIQAFKGMESTVVVLCDVESAIERESQSLLYVAMSRARSQLTVLLHKRVKPYYDDCLRRKLMERWQR